jgi:hypothetical protein
MQVEIDQTGKIGKTNEDTVLAFSNGIQSAVLITRAVKQACLRTLRRRGYESNTIYLRLFVAGLYYLLCQHMAAIDLAVIDVEYPGHNDTIRRYLLNLLQRDGLDIHKERIAFNFVGKDSPAHAVALAPFRRQRQPDKVLTVEQLLAIV